MSKPTFQE